MLWDEWESGIDGSKAAKRFTATEHGKVEYTYHCQKSIWQQVAVLVQAGLTASVAIDQVYDVYGHDRPVSYIINQMRQDQKDSGHPKFRI